MTDLETTYMILGILVSLSTVVTVFAMAIRWLVKHYFDEIKSQFKPNGGGSLKDQVNRLESRMDKSDTLRKANYDRLEKLDAKIDDLYNKFITYLSNKD